MSGGRGKKLGREERREKCRRVIMDLFKVISLGILFLVMLSGKP